MAQRKLCTRSFGVVRSLLVLQRRLTTSPSKVIDRKMMQDMVKEQQKFKKGEICDIVCIYTRGGAGGQGYRRKNGVGGNGGNVWLEALPVYQNLNHVHHHHNRRYVAGPGDNATNEIVRGRQGEDSVVEVPPGTVATDIKTGETVCDVDQENTRYLLQGGEKGGSLVNNYKSKRGEERFLRLVLKSIADVGLVGYPNAGKSSLLSVLSTATPTIGSYPFTTLKPTVGHLQTTDTKQTVKIADIPGLIEGASNNRGLGHVFLQHIERTKVLLFVLDVQGFKLNLNTPHRTPFETFGYLCRELELYMAGLTRRPIVVAINKMDTGGSDSEFEEFLGLYKTKLSKMIRVHSIVPISCYTGQGLDQLQDILFELKYKKRRKIKESDVV